MIFINVKINGRYTMIATYSLIYYKMSLKKTVSFKKFSYSFVKLIF